MNSLILLKDELPIKGKDIVGYDDENNKYYVFRCNCHNEKCVEFRCSITGYHICCNIIKWEYVK